MRVPGERIGMSNVIVVGCGRVGSQLANMLSDNGNNEPFAIFQQDHTGKA